MIMQRQWPVAMALIRGDEGNPMLRGIAEFYPQEEGTWIDVRVWGLPQDGFFALHIHEGGICAGKDFSQTFGHWNPGNASHPEHAGDLPPLLAYKGRARFGVWIGRIRASDVAGKTVVIHNGPDDFHTQPAGNAGEKIACGMIEALDKEICL